VEWMAVYKVIWWSGFLTTWGGDNYTRYSTDYYKAAGGGGGKDFQQSHVIEYTGTELRNYRIVLKI
jgi:hypothetical protein